MPHEIRWLSFTKEMDALPLRHPRSPILSNWASERARMAPREWLHVIFANYPNLKNTAPFTSFPAEVCKLE
jgi:hypothetical protein